jgi:triosephosphate isomerase
MNGSTVQAVALTTELLQAGIGSLGTDIAICPPNPYLALVAQAMAQVPVVLGAQNLHVEDSGAYTGEVSGAMLWDVGCRYVIVGHSERRRLCCETDSIVADKVLAAQRNGLVPIVCVGESLEERQNECWREVIMRQLDNVLGRGIGVFDQMVVAYEPIWAIGTGKTASPEQAQEVHALIRMHLEQAGVENGAALRILYGGSVNAGNAQALFAMPDIDGALVGGASLNAAEFVNICRAAEREELQLKLRS